MRINRTTKFVTAGKSLEQHLARVKDLSSKTNRKVRQHKIAIEQLMKEGEELERLNKQRRAETQRLEIILQDQSKKVDEAKLLIEKTSLVIQQEKELENKIANSKNIVKMIDGIPKMIIDLEQKIVEAQKQSEKEHSIRIGAINRLSSNIQVLKGLVDEERISEVKEMIKKECEIYNSHKGLIDQINVKTQDLKTLTLKSTEIIPFLVDENQTKKTSGWRLVAIASTALALTVTAIYTGWATKVIHFLQDLLFR